MQNTSIIQPSPITYGHIAEPSKIGSVHGMAVALKFGNGDEESKRRQLIGIADISCLSRFGVKGPNAVQWLRAHKVDLPEERNSWVATSSGAVVLRLGNSEFLIEDSPTSSLAPSLASDPPKMFGVYTVRRSDASLVLSGSRVQELLAEVCTLDLSEKALGKNAVVMTQVAGISATVLRQSLNGETVYRLWCDGTYGTYMWHTLVEIAEELGGGAVGLSSYFKELA
ncbi:uncharacterized protein NMK_1013 [Novimethylophilus kurashikiensis]|uniref:GCVT N-terminal domain-containing protein n=1 Tax=Novimethylophilus kurashikiensis TaxID=1825523 RepID=A0A2R5F507_9PROT|nr:sarcosine oxidase subunit gamma [Novimethylophilus kurashikiensis]GBG13466.1 uncharacterized protein NMK_1013 [Novimethylophilus kurashikiensis]